MTAPTHDLIGVGSPIIDYLAHIDDAFLSTVEGEKGGMVLVENAMITEALSRVPGGVARSPGGSSGNTTFAAARLGLRAAFVGKVGADAEGDYYRARFEEWGGDAGRFLVGDVATGRCLSLITPDAKRTMRTHLGAAMTLAPDEISRASFAGARHIHIEGYLLFNYDLMMSVLRSAQAVGCTVSLDLASFEVVQAAKAFLPALLEEYIDVVFANEDEAASLLGDDLDFPGMARKLAQWCSVAVVKLGADGSLIAHENILHTVAPVKVEHVLDTTGAGDAFGAGFLYGWLREKPLPECGRLGSELGAAVVQIDGAEIPEDRWQALLPRLGA